MKEELKVKRDSLKALSNSVKLAIQMGQTEVESVNAGLVEIYQQQGHTEIHSFKKWLELGKVVKRGEKALLLWGEPRKIQKQETPENAEADEYKFYPLAYMFSQLQVEPLKR